MRPPHPADTAIEKLLLGADQGRLQPVVLVTGDLVLAEPAARRLAEGLAAALGCQLSVRRRPESLAPLLADLRTHSLFEPAKVTLAVDTAVFADQRAAADLVDAAAEVLPLAADGSRELSRQERKAASRLLQGLRLFELDPSTGEPAELLATLPAAALQGGSAFRRGRGGRGRGPRQVEDLRQELVPLLVAARGAGIVGRDGGDLAVLAAVLQGELPDRHCLVLAESSVTPDHPLVEGLARRGAVLAMGSLEAERGELRGLETVAEELERQTGIGIEGGALAELARRTLRQGRDRQGSIDAASSGRFAGEYRKLAALAAGRRAIDRALVEQAVEDRGEEDVWALLDAVGEGRGAEALARYRRMMTTAADEDQARLTFFALLAEFCRQVTAVQGLIRLLGLPAGEHSYPRFKTRWAEKLGGPLPDGERNPLAGLHPFRLHRAYLTASRFPEHLGPRLPAWLLEAELRVKGDSSEPDTVIMHLLARLAESTTNPRGRR